MSDHVMPKRDDTYARVHEPKLLAGLVLGETLLYEELDNLLGNTNSGTASTKEDGAVVLEINACVLDGVDEAGKNDGAGALDVVIEASVGVLVTLESREGILEILKLNNDAANCQSVAP